MKSNPEQMTLAKLQVVVMPNGEVICAGNRVGWVNSESNGSPNVGEYLSDLKNALTGESIENE